MICSTFCGSGFFAAAVELVGLCEADGAALADAAVAGVVGAGVVLAVAGVVALFGVGLAVVLGAALAVAFVFGDEGAGLALGDVVALVAGAFLSFRGWVVGCFLSAGLALVVAVVADCSALVAVAGALVFGFFSCVVVAGVIAGA